MLGYIKNKDWDLFQLENSWIKLSIAPNLGGRLIQLEMDGHEFFFVNSSLEGCEPDSTRLGANGSWLNFGGEKIWPSPQGWDTPNQWPGPPDPVLDGGVYSLSEISDNFIKLTSPFDPFTGLQIEKEVKLSDSTSEIIVNASFCNKSDIQREWSIWPVLQMNTSEMDVEDQYKVICPVNPKSKFPNGYKIMHGLVNCPQYKINADGNMELDYQYLVGKIGLDADSGWTAFIDAQSGKVFVLMFQFEENMPYPEDTSIQFWTAGKGLVYSRNVIREHRDDKELNPPYLEMELLSPLKMIQPGESIHFEYRMLTCTIPERGVVKSVNPLGVISSPLQAEWEDDKLIVTAKYGVYKAGIIQLNFKDEAGNLFENVPEIYSGKASPVKGIEIDIKIDKDKCLFDREVHLVVDFFDLDNHFVGLIDHIKI